MDMTHSACGNIGAYNDVVAGFKPNVLTTLPFTSLKSQLWATSLPAVGAINAAAKISLLYPFGGTVGEFKVGCDHAAARYKVEQHRSTVLFMK